MNLSPQPARPCVRQSRQQRRYPRKTGGTKEPANILGCTEVMQKGSRKNHHEIAKNYSGTSGLMHMRNTKSHLVTKKPLLEVYLHSYLSYNSHKISKVVHESQVVFFNFSICFIYAPINLILSHHIISINL